MNVTAEQKFSSDDLSEEASPASGVRRANPIDVHVGGRMRLRRMMIGMSQEKLGELMGLTFQQVQKYEKGVNRVSASRLFNLSHILTVPVEFFYEGLTVNGAPDATPGFAESSPDDNIFQFLGSRDGLELNRAFVQIKDPKVRRHIVDLVRSLAEKAEQQG